MGRGSTFISSVEMRDPQRQLAVPDILARETGRWDNTMLLASGPSVYLQFQLVAVPAYGVSSRGLGVLLVWLVSPSIARNLRRTRRGSAQDDSEPANGTLTKAGDKRTRGGRVLGALGGHYGDGLAFLEGPEEGMASISVVYSDHSSMIFQGLLVMQIYRAAKVLA